MLSEMNECFYGLGLLNQTVVQAAGTSVSPSTEIQIESSITIILV